MTKLSERTLRKWRKEAFEGISPNEEIMLRQLMDAQQQILKMTQELLDNHLIKK